MEPSFKKQLGQTEVMLPRLGFGGGTMGDPTEIITEEQATSSDSSSHTEVSSPVIGPLGRRDSFLLHQT